MVELLGILLALALLGLGLLAARLIRRFVALLRRLGGSRRRPRRLGERHHGRPGPASPARLRGQRLRRARTRARAQAARIAALTAELERSRRALRLAEAALARPGPPEGRFLRAKRAFARRKGASCARSGPSPCNSTPTGCAAPSRSAASAAPSSGNSGRSCGASSGADRTVRTGARR